MKDSLNIWMAHYPKDGVIKAAFQDSCGTEFNTVGINGGEVWNDVFNAIKGDYHVSSGDSRSVSAAGGWLQGVGLSHTCRLYGLGIDNVVSFEVVLPDGQQVVADACQNTDLFWALRGGGGGTFGVVTHVEYKVHPKTKITYIRFFVFDATAAAVRMFLNYWAAKTPFFDNRVGGSFFGPTYFEVYIVGDMGVASEVFLNDFEDWFDNVYEEAGFRGSWTAKEHDSWYALQDGTEIFTDVPRRGHGREISTRLVPEYMVLDNPGDIVDFLVNLFVDDNEEWGSYWLGGVTNNVDAHATAVHPVMRNSIWAITTTTEFGAQRVRDYLPNSISGCSYNHHSGSEPNWRVSLWGEDHHTRLLGIKNRYDPNRRLNCWHCVGYQGLEYEAEEEIFALN